MSCGGNHTALIDSTGTLYMCGSNEDGQLGLMLDHDDGDDEKKKCHLSVLFKKVTYFENIKIKQVSCGWNHTLVVSCDGKVYSFGQGQHGQLGLGKDYLRKVFEPKEVRFFFENENEKEKEKENGKEKETKKKFIPIQICSGMRHSIVLGECGRVFVWGYSRQGQIGLTLDSKTSYVSEPVELTKVHTEMGKITHMSTGQNHTILMNEQGKLYGFGSNKFKQLTKEDITFYSSPVLISVSDDIGEVDKVFSSWNSLYLMNKEGKLFSKGKSDYGQLGRILKDIKDFSEWGSVINDGTMKEVSFIYLSFKNLEIF
jgi:alpha-tubulin suppressor-like RCC1 family protein